MKLDEFKRPIIVLTAFGRPTVISSAASSWQIGPRDGVIQPTALP
jgi:hypothetical protein